MVLADRRFQKKRNQLPKWIAQALPDQETNLSVDQAVAVAKKFLREMSVPYPKSMQAGISSWDEADLRRHQAKRQEEEIRMLQMQQEEAMRNGVQRRRVVDFDDDEIDDDALMELDM
jgi:DNA excision repair protein ERCC-2